jgi:hypothetical protein
MHALALQDIPTQLTARKVIDDVLAHREPGSKTSKSSSTISCDPLSTAQLKGRLRAAFFMLGAGLLSGLLGGLRSGLDDPASLIGLRQ